MARKRKMAIRKNWKQFRKTGLLLFINQVLHVFGWAIVFDINKGEIKDVYPARVRYRGFDGSSVDKCYRDISTYMVKNSKKLLEEAKD